MRLAELAFIDLAAADAAALSLPQPRLTLRRAWPRSADHLLLEFLTGDDQIVPGQWLRNEKAMEQIAAETRGGAVEPQHIRPVRHGARGCRILLQMGGEDRVLRGLAPRVALPSSHLLVHRPERRAVVRCGEGEVATFAKFLPQKRIAELARREELLRSVSNDACFAMAPILEVAGEVGMVRYAAAPGASLHDLLPCVDDDVMRAVGRALRGLHELSIEYRSLPEHGPLEEVGVLSRWMNHLRAFDFARAAELEEDCERVMSGLRAESGAPERGPIHRDFYDKQIFVHGDQITLLDFDTVAAGEPALDIGNMLAHLEHRGARAALARAFLEGYGNRVHEMETRLDVYREAARLRLHCVHAFRPPYPSAERLSAAAGSSSQ